MSSPALQSVTVTSCLFQGSEGTSFLLRDIFNPKIKKGLSESCLLGPVDPHCFIEKRTGTDSLNTQGLVHNRCYFGACQPQKGSFPFLSVCYVATRLGLYSQPCFASENSFRPFFITENSSSPSAERVFPPSINLSLKISLTLCTLVLYGELSCVRGKLICETDNFGTEQQQPWAAENTELQRRVFEKTSNTHKVWV